jgi:hypothetical protein
MSLCHQSSFSAESTMITIVPSFHYPTALPILSSPHQQSIGPFVAGMPVQVPLWIAKTLHQRQLAQIELPEWLASADMLAQILQEERESVLLTKKLPYYYFEIARSLDFCLPKSSQILLQDLMALRSDKLRQHFHEMSRTTLQEPPHHDEDGGGGGDNEGDEDALPLISVTGIASYEINKMGPFLQRAFSDYGYLTKRSVEPEGEEKDSSSGKTVEDASVGEDEDIDKGSQESHKVSKIRSSRLRRFRS